WSTTSPTDGTTSGSTTSKSYGTRSWRRASTPRPSPSAAFARATSPRPARSTSKAVRTRASTSRRAPSAEPLHQAGMAPRARQEALLAARPEREAHVGLLLARLEKQPCDRGGRGGAFAGRGDRAMQAGGILRAQV